MQEIKVLMSTYNGEKYLDEQIQTILNQEGVKVILAIRDDGSTDSTRVILDKYENNPFVEITYGDNIGYTKSFLWLLNRYKNTADYFAFSDQDDYWLEDKLYSALNKIKRSNNLYNLYYSNLIITDEKLKKTGIKKFNDRKITLGSSLTRSNLAGCTMVFNNNLAKEVTKIPLDSIINIGHDAWVQYICLLLEGNLIYDRDSYICFRRHKATTTNLNKKIFDKIRYEYKSSIKNPNKTYISALVIKEYFYKDIGLTNRYLIDKIINYKNSLNSKIKLMISEEIRTDNTLIDMYSLIRIILNKY